MNLGFTVRFSSQGEVRLARRVPDPARPAVSSLLSIARDVDGTGFAALVGSLHYVADLRARFPGLRGMRDGSDADLALAVYREAGVQGLEKLEGEFALLLLDACRRRLLAMRDACGTYPLYWHRGDSGMVVSTSPQALLEHGADGRLDHDYLAEFLIAPFPRSEMATEITAYQGIRRVLPGTIAMFEADGRLTQHRYWSWRERIEPAAPTTLEDAGLRFAHLFQGAVRERLQNAPVLAHLSGGMDSTAVACVARSLLTASNAPGPLHTVSLVYQGLGLAGERACLDVALDSLKGCETHFLRGEDILDFDWFSQPLPYHDEPYSGLRVLATHRAFARAAEKIGAAAMLTGLGSDEILDSAPFHIADLIRSGRWLTAYAEGKRWAYAWNQGIWSILGSFGMPPLLPAWLRQGVRTWWRGGVGVWPRIDWFTVPPWLRRDFARRHDLGARARDHARRFFKKPTALSVELSGVEFSSGDWGRWYLTAPRGIRLGHPFRDPRVVTHTLGVARDIRSRPGQRKPLLQQAMRGILPEPIRVRRDKRGFDDVYARGLARSLPALEQMIRRSSIDRLEVLDKDVLIACLRDAALGIADLQAKAHLEKALALIAWHDMIARTPATVASIPCRLPAPREDHSFAMA